MSEVNTSAMRGLHSLPAVDERLVMPESGYEIIDGKVVEVSHADEPRGTRQAKLGALLEAHIAAGYDAALKMLTRTSALDDFAPDASVYPLARDPVTGGRQLEELAFEVVSTESLGRTGRRAAKLIQRGVRRVFAIDVDRLRCLEWSVSAECWELLAQDAVIEDPALAVRLQIHDLVGPERADDAVARALLAKRNPVLIAAIARAGATQGKADAVLEILVSRGMPPTDEQRRAILEARDPATVDRWLANVASCSTIEALFAG